MLPLCGKRGEKKTGVWASDLLSAVGNVSDPDPHDILIEKVKWVRIRVRELLNAKMAVILKSK